jgi:hypothetical protein
MRERPRRSSDTRCWPCSAEGLLSQERIELLSSWRRSGFSVHNRVFVHPGDGREFEALVRYMMRPPVSPSQLHFTPGSHEVPFSCRTRSFCPSCEKKHALLWAEWLRQELLAPVAHRHVVSTIPRLLRPLFRRRRELLIELGHAASEALFAWPLLLAPLLLVATASFALSLTRPALLVYGILLGVPYLLLPVLEAWVGSWEASHVPLALRLFSARVIDNLDLLFPRWSQLVIWPRIALPTPERPPLPAWGLEATHALAATAFWVVAGLWAYRRHDFGSRLPTK